jgi:hypothetical protein
VALALNNPGRTAFESRAMTSLSRIVRLARSCTVVAHRDLRDWMFAPPWATAACSSSGETARRSLAYRKGQRSVERFAVVAALGTK